ncbi:MAG TPA: hypothetical protein VMF61_11625 [Candidatus Acidoferrales bacterium]|nr:hypothetical protein [Candidatus Acidoferrales bacterium]
MASASKLASPPWSTVAIKLSASIESPRIHAYDARAMRSRARRRGEIVCSGVSVSLAR